ncbi:MAG: ATP-dependent helicase [Paracoccaceae bacterium]
MSSFDEMDAFEGASLSARAMAARPQPYLDQLNPAQREAVETLEGPVLMLAGAGTGKTKALTCRVVHLLNTGKARPNEILSVTFTNKAAREMKTRVGDLLGHAVEGLPWMGTFHSICVKLLRRHAELVGLKSNFTILDTDDQLRLLKQLVSAANIDEKRWPARQLAGIIDNWKNRAWTPEKVPSAEAGAYNNLGTEIYAQYQSRLRDLNAVDFGDLLLLMVTIFQNHSDVLEQYQRWFKYILVDEYQDTNVAQYMWLRLLAGGHKNICCVGDDDQSIYGWRGAEVGNILRFEKDFPGAKVVRLEQNYRSTPHILAAASGVISGNQGRLGKELWTDLPDGEKVRLIGHWDGEEEARWIGEEVEATQRGTRGLKGFGLDDMAILVRASHQMRAFEDRFLTIGLPYRVIGGPRFYERMEIRDAMAYFRVVTSPEDDLAFERIVNTPKRGLGDKAQQKMQIMARSHGVPLIEGARLLLENQQISGKGAKELSQLLEAIWRWGRLAGDADMSHVELAEIILDESGYTEMWQANKTPEAPGRLENLKELVKALEEFENIQGFLEHVSLVMDNDSEEGGEKVSIMTLHAAKGLEFPVVFLPGWEDGLFPSQRSMDESGLKGLEEERRLAYVGITRAEQICTISFAGNRRVFGQWQSSMPSRFIDELPEQHIEVLTPPGLYGGGYGAAGVQSEIEKTAAETSGYDSPGWKRMQARTSQRPISQPKEQNQITINATALSVHTEGERVFHQKFGYGTVIGIEGDKLEISFEKAGVKKVVARFVTGADDIPF